MEKRFDVFFPKPGAIFHRSRFVAYGKGKTSAEVKGTLVNQAGQPVGRVVPLLRSKKVWALLVTDIVLGRPYTLTILDALSGRPLAQVDNLIVEPDHFFIGIDYPTDTDLPVAPSFLVYGPTDELTALTASLNPEDNEQITLLFGPPDNPGYYCFEYDNVTPGTYTPGVTLQGSGSPTTDSVVVQ